MGMCSSRSSSDFPQPVAGENIASTWAAISLASAADPEPRGTLTSAPFRVTAEDAAVSHSYTVVLLSAGPHALHFYLERAEIMSELKTLLDRSKASGHSRPSSP